MAAIHNELESILRVHAPHKLDHLDDLISRHAGREHVLLNKIRAKYGFPKCVNREHARGPCQQSMQQNSCALSHGLRKHNFSISRDGGAPFRRRRDPPRAPRTGAEKFRGDCRISGWRNDLPRGLDRRILDFAAQQRASCETPAEHAAFDAEAYVQRLEQAMANAASASNTNGGASDGENVSPAALSDTLQRMWQAASNAHSVARQVCAGATAVLLSIVSNASNCELLSARGKANVKDVKVALLLLRRMCETRAGRRAVMLYNRSMTDDEERQGEDKSESEGESTQDMSGLSGPAILLQAVTHGTGKMRTLASEVIERLVRSSVALDALFALGMQPAMVSRTKSIRAAEIARLSGHPVTFRLPKESAIAMAGNCLF